MPVNAIGHSIVIDRAANGWIVRVGCMMLVFDTETLVTEISRYLANPEEVTKQYVTKYGGMRVAEQLFEPPEATSATATGLYGGGKRAY